MMVIGENSQQGQMKRSSCIILVCATYADLYGGFGPGMRLTGQVYIAFSMLAPGEDFHFSPEVQRLANCILEPN
jgi:hypothetical protein